MLPVRVLQKRIHWPSGDQPEHPYLRASDAGAWGARHDPSDGHQAALLVDCERRRRHSPVKIRLSRLAPWTTEKHLSAAPAHQHVPGSPLRLGHGAEGPAHRSTSCPHNHAVPERDPSSVRTPPDIGVDGSVAALDEFYFTALEVGAEEIPEAYEGNGAEVRFRLVRLGLRTLA